MDDAKRMKIRAVARNYARQCEFWNVSLISVVQETFGKVLTWRPIAASEWENKPNEAICFERVLPNQVKQLYIMTIAPDVGGVAVFCLVHEIAHLILGHLDDVPEGTLQFGSSSEVVEEDANYFAMVFFLLSSYKFVGKVPIVSSQELMVLIPDFLEEYNSSEKVVAEIGRILVWDKEEVEKDKLKLKRAAHH